MCLGSPFQASQGREKKKNRYAELGEKEVLANIHFWRQVEVGHLAVNGVLLFPSQGMFCGAAESLKWTALCEGGNMVLNDTDGLDVVCELFLQL